MAGDSEDFVEVFAGSPVKAGMIRSLLEADGLMAFVRDENAATIWPSPLVGAGLGAAKVVVPRDQADRAREILANVGA
ncbi:MAG TPA: DUF2007 domain-containing protein [Planctomycetota bacterium]|nr:DUF2007 domain-containing protein [Planctomycetota bacterium]